MVEAIVLWNEPNNLSHWNFHLDPDWARFSDMVKRAAAGIRSVRDNLPIVLGGVSSCDCDFLRLMASYQVMDSIDVVGVHGFPLDWNQFEEKRSAFIGTASLICRRAGRLRPAIKKLKVLLIIGITILGF